MWLGALERIPRASWWLAGSGWRLSGMRCRPPRRWQIACDSDDSCRRGDARPRPAGRRLHRAWWVAAVILGALVAAAGFRSSTGALLEPLESEFGWSRATTSGAVTANLVIYGLTAPFAAALMERFGLRRVVSLALRPGGHRQRPHHGDDRAVAALAALGRLRRGRRRARWRSSSARSSRTGGSCESRRGLVTGVFSAAGAAGQLVFLPGIAALATGPGWRYAALVVTGAALLLVPLVLLVVRDRPADLGLRPLGAQPGDALDEPATRHTGSQVGPAAWPCARCARARARARSGSCSGRSGSAAGRPTG